MLCCFKHYFDIKQELQFYPWEKASSSSQFEDNLLCLRYQALYCLLRYNASKKSGGSAASYSRMLAGRR